MHASTIKLNLIKITFLFLFSFLQFLSAGQNKGEITIPGLYKMPETNIQNTESTSNAKSGVKEDLHKFMGYEILPARYFSLPFDVPINNNLNFIFTDVGFLLLLILPILFLLPTRRTDQEQKPSRKALLNLALMALLTLFLIISVPSAYLNKHNFTTLDEGLNLLKTPANTGVLDNFNKIIKTTLFHLYTPFHQYFSSFSGKSDAITYPILLILFIVLLFLVYFRIKKHTKITKAVILFLTTYFFLWWVLGSGAAWYGILLFCVPYIFLAKGIGTNNSKFPSLKNISASTLKNGIIMCLCFFWVLMAFAFRSTNYVPTDEERAKHIYIPPILEYQMGNIEEKELLNIHLANYHEIKEVINQDDRSLVYRVGTSINYFIKKNDRRVFNDTYLDFFNLMVKKFKTKEKIIQALKASGFKYIVIDLNMSDNDYTKEKTLTRKFIQLMNTLYNNPNIELLATNRTIKLNSNGQIINAVFEDKGAIVNSGQIALFRIK